MQRSLALSAKSQRVLMPTVTMAERPWKAPVSVQSVSSVAMASPRTSKFPSKSESRAVMGVVDGAMNLCDGCLLCAFLSDTCLGSSHRRQENREEHFAIAAVILCCLALSSDVAVRWLGAFSATFAAATLGTLCLH